MARSPFSRPLVLLLATLGLAGFARAETTDWIGNEGGRARLVALPAGPDGTRRGMIEIEPSPGWITYWREPGDSGIPPQLSLSAPASLLSMDFPAPKVLKLGSLTDIGYDAPVALPIRIGNAAGKITADLFIGLCKDICIPFQASFTLDPAHGHRPEEERAVAAAEAAVPPAGTEGLAIRAGRLSPEGDRMTLSLALSPPGAEAEAVLTGPSGYVFTARGKADATGVLSLDVPLKGLKPGPALKSLPWRVLLMTQDKAIEADLTPE
ncbi:protein-disulfide reductase DsbD domain-containing protein [Gellertiella hungarica]|uniref:DsbC/DsbD-like thiol-disulfide interchange protein n=1 Tax=Gellertiella hungarica TaxID=1572859 RepID=A0A7W6J463_9HYPH|nr:protein-disulfide reductase DsbD domain-containing protein [Gellertiella hungarica]MBB4064451.1 DsbC/DsbD-like thiol-disulfide interchange protein [Gellertiella hungarica]